MKILNDEGIWTLEYYCLGNGPSDINEDEGCYTLFALEYEDINYYEHTNEDDSKEYLYSFICPECHKETVIDEVLIPEAIKSKIRDNNGYNKEYVRKYSLSSVNYE